MNLFRKAMLATAAITLAIPTTASAQLFGGGRNNNAQAAVINEVPRCTQNFGTLSIADTQAPLFSQMGLGSPTEVLRQVVRDSGCFRLIERGPGMDVIERERGLGAAGRIRTADFVLVAELSNSIDADSSDRSSGLMGTLAASGGRLLMQAGVAALTGGEGGAEMGQGMSQGMNQLLNMGTNMANNQLNQSLNSRTVDSLKGLQKDLGKGKEDAQIVMSLASVPLAEQVGYARSIANKDELRRLRIRDNHFSGRVGAGYETEDEGKVIALALVRAYADLVTTLGGTGSSTPEVVLANREAIEAAESDRRAEVTRAREEADRARNEERRAQERAERARREEEDRIREEIRREERARMAAESEIATTVAPKTEVTRARPQSDNAPVASSSPRTINRTTVMRDAPSGQALAPLESGTTVNATGRTRDGWVEVQIQNGTVGWVQADRV